MNSSGIKRGLATTAVSALAVAGIPFIATSASAATGDVLEVVSVGVVRNGGDQGLQIVAKVKGITAGDVKIADKSLGDINPDTLDQSIGTITPGPAIASGSDEDSNPTDGLAEQVFYVSDITTRNDGGTYEFAIFEDENNGDDVDDTEARAQVSGVTSGAPVKVVASPTYQTAPEATDSGDYVLTLQDSANRVTQLDGTEELRLRKVSGPGNVTFTPEGSLTNPFSATEVGRDGKVSFVAKADDEGLHVLRAGVFADDTTTTESFGANMNLDVSGGVAGAGSITPEMINVVTGADNREGYDQTTTDVQVRQDQNSITFEIKAPAQKGKIVSLTATSATGAKAVTFGGKATQTKTVTLDDKGVGSVTFTVDAASIQTGDEFEVDGSALSSAFDFTFVGASLAAGDVDADQTLYFSSFGGTVNPTVTVTDQFGEPVTNAYVTYQITTGPNAGNESARVKTDENGEVTFSITDTKATTTNQADGQLTFKVYADAFTPTASLTDTGSRIDYSADGQGADFLITVDGQVPGGAVYNPTINPLTDAVANNAGDSTDEDATLAIAGGTTDAPATVTVDNGGLILDGGTTLADGVSTLTGTVSDTFEIVGTTAGTVNVTVVSGGKTQTATLEVETLEDNSATARNLELEGPDGAVAGDVVDFTATITDAFGNPVTGFDGDDIDTRITGPGNEQGNSGDSDENGEITFSVEITQGASSPVTLRIEGDDTVAQFGADEDRLTAAAATDNAPGLTESQNVASATVDVVDIEELEQAVEDAEAALAAAEADLAEAVAELDVAQAQLAIAQSEVDRLQERKQNLRQKLNKAKAKGNKQKAKTTRKKLRNAKSQLRDAKNNLTVAQAAVDGEQAVVDLREEAVTEAEEALAQAQADLDEAQNG